MERALATVRRWGKTPVRSADSARVHRQSREPAVHARGAADARDGRGHDRGDRRGRPSTAGFPMGPFALMDLIGIDINLAAARGVFEGFGGAGDSGRRAVPAVADPGAARRRGPARSQDRRGVLSLRRDGESGGPGARSSSLLSGVFASNRPTSRVASSRRSSPRPDAPWRTASRRRTTSISP